MNLHIQHITNSQGINQYVQIPVQEFDRLLNDYNRLKRVSLVEKKIKRAIRQSHQIENGVIHEKSLSDFLDEC